MSLAVVRQIRSKYPTPLGGRHAEFLVELARTLNHGLLLKPSGTRIRLPKPWDVDVAQDIICILDARTGTATHYDVLEDGEGEARPGWSLVGPIDPKRYLSVSASEPVPVPTPAPGDTMAACLADMRAVLARMDALTK